MGVRELIESLYIKVASNTNLALDNLWMLLHREADVNEDVIIAGTFRSGTTWLMEIIGTLKDYKFVFEPFHRYFYPRSRVFESLSYPPPWRPYVYYMEENTLLYNYVHDFLKGKVAGRWYCSPSFLFKNITRSVLSSKILVKITWGIRLIPWIAHHFKVKAIYLILRHPCAVIESWIRTSIGNPLSIYNINVVKKSIISQARNINELRNKRDTFEFLERLNKPEEILAAIYSIDYYIPLIHKDEGRYHIIFYEDLLLNPNEELERIFRYINECVPKDICSLIKAPSFTAHEKSTTEIYKNLTKWCDRLSRQQIDNIINVVHHFGLTFYDEKPEPHKG